MLCVSSVNNFNPSAHTPCPIKLRSQHRYLRRYNLILKLHHLFWKRHSWKPLSECGDVPDSLKHLQSTVFWNFAFSFAFKKEAIYVVLLVFAGDWEAAQNDGAAWLSDQGVFLFTLKTFTHWKQVKTETPRLVDPNYSGVWQFAALFQSINQYSSSGCRFWW